jgi:hypothetical protein
MHAMQYAITLPADYDMSIIHRRVAQKGHLLDRLPGLGLKAYLVRERSTDCPVNQYAPFYLWTQGAAMAAFLWGGGGFQGIVADFGRPPVHHWTGARFARGPAVDAPARTATLTRQRLAADVNPQDALATADAAHDHHAELDEVHSTAVAVDPSRWEIVHFTLWAVDAPCAAAQQRFRVLHLSAPHLDDLVSAA